MSDLIASKIERSSTPNGRPRRFGLRTLFLLVAVAAVAVKIAPIFFGFLGAAAVIVWSYVVVVANGQAWKLGRYAYIATSLVVAGFTVWTTFYCVYYPNPNTRFEGWPIPMVVFQRQDATSPWLDYVGLTTLLAWPMNFVIFMFAPAVVFLIAAYVRAAKMS